VTPTEAPTAFDFQERESVLDTLSLYMPLAYTAGVRALRSWSEQLPHGELTLTSATGRDVALYLGPARRVFGNPNATLRHGRGRCALVVNRVALRPAWSFAPVDTGELLFHWRQDRLAPEYSRLDVQRFVERSLLPVGQLQATFRAFLDAGYEDPWDYLNSWVPPRVSLAFPPEQNAIYRAASERWFGRVRGFAPAWTFEVHSPAPVTLGIEHVLGAVLVDDNATRMVEAERVLRDAFGDRLHVVQLPEHLVHPDLSPMLLEASTVAIAHQYLEGAVRFERVQALPRPDHEHTRNPVAA
jgi:hypothetical protein